MVIDIMLCMVGYKIVDYIYQKLFGVCGVFVMCLLYVIKIGNCYQLQIFDLDGQNVCIVLLSIELIILLVWLLSGMKVVYVLFECKKLIVYIYDLLIGCCYMVFDQKGNNSVLVWLLDSNMFVVVLLLMGNM